MFHSVLTWNRFYFRDAISCRGTDDMWFDVVNQYEGIGKHLLIFRENWNDIFMFTDYFT